MNKIKMMLAMMVIFVFALISFAPTANALQRFEDESIEITSKLPPQWLGYKVHVGSVNTTVPFYYKVSAVVPGIGETYASPVTTAYAAYGPLSSTMAIRMMWAPVAGATDYKLYKSVNNSAFYLLGSFASPILTYVDEGATLGAAYSTPTPRNGNLEVENNLTVGGTISGTGALATSTAFTAGTTITAGTGIISTAGPIRYYSRTKAQILAISGPAIGDAYYCSDCTAVRMCVSTGTVAGSFVKITDAARCD